MKRNFSLDYVKAISCFSVIALHFRYNLQGSIPPNSFGMKPALFMSVIYQLFITCVPLFILSTGYLMSHKKPNKSYYIGIFKLVTLYVICSLFVFGVFHLYSGLELSLIEIVLKISSFELIGYSWYVEMYLGLALFIPVINMIIEKLDKKELLIGLSTLIAVISIPAFFNAIPYLDCFIQLPSYWSNTYPILYYIIGAGTRKYFREEKVQKKSTIFAIYVIALLMGIFMNLAHANPYVGGGEGGYASLLVVVQSSALFILIQIFLKKENKLIIFISNLTLSIYLTSFLADKICYPLAIDIAGSAKNVIPYMPIVSGAIFILSCLMGYICNTINTLFWKLITRRSIR